LKVLYWTPLFWPDLGGIETLAMRALPALRDRGYEFTVVASTGPRGLDAVGDYEGIPVFRYPILRAFARKDLRVMAAALTGVAALKKRVEPDLVHIHLGPISINLFHLRTAAAWDAPTLLTLQTLLGDHASAPGPLLAETLRQAKWITAPSEAVISDVRRADPAAAGKLSLIHNAVEAPPFDPASPGIEEPVILGLGRLVREKGFDRLIEAFALIRSRHPRARLCLAGDGPVRADLQALAAGLGLDGAVDFRGWVPPGEVFRLIETAAVVAVPSRWQETFAVVLLEAARVGRPVVATRVGGTPESVADGETGILVEPEDARGLAAAVTGLLDDPARAAAMGRRARERAQTLFGWTAYLDAFDALYRRLGAGAR